MASRSLRKLTREPPTAEDVEHLISDMANVDDRAAAIITGTMVEDALRSLLLSGMVRLDNTQQSDLFGAEKPLSSFSAKIRIAHAFGLCDSKAANKLAVIKDVRNAFAHAPRRISFDTPAIAHAVEELKIPNLLLVYVKRPDRPIIPSGELAFATNRNAFLTMCQFYEVNIRNTINVRGES